MRVLKVKIVDPPRQPGQPDVRYGFIEFQTKPMADQALAMSGSLVLDNLALRISRANGPIGPACVSFDPDTCQVTSNTVPKNVQSVEVTKTVYISNIPTGTDEQALVDLCSSVGRVVKAKLAGDENQMTRYGFVEFETGDAAQAAITQLQGYELAGRALTVAPSHQGASSAQPAVALPVGQKTIYVNNIDCSLPEGEVIEFFNKRAGHVIAHRIPAPEAGQQATYGFFEFGSGDEAAKAMALNGETLGRFNINCKLSKASIQSNVRTVVPADISQLATLTGVSAGGGGGDVPTSVTAEAREESRRAASTVYVSGLDGSKIVEETLHYFFQAKVGMDSVKYATLLPIDPDLDKEVKVEVKVKAERGERPTRVQIESVQSRRAEVEFTSPEYAQKALRLTGTAIPPSTLTITVKPKPPPQPTLFAPALLSGEFKTSEEDEGASYRGALMKQVHDYQEWLKKKHQRQLDEARQGGGLRSAKRQRSRSRSGSEDEGDRRRGRRRSRSR
eukprot:NODE_851_length_1738_cov_35.545885_g698_i0.p1 GENE.NODE_851_length_1738_cov_35.545885_g698_i0~~NODE_851_length_1738_cov_35.545885_g698_i0.p1  ORF type:complete len:547 (+),score=164.18 NODE_851_length_1738_cov_35.545885_g698_i0:132-1643(+)